MIKAFKAWAFLLFITACCSGFSGKSYADPPPGDVRGIESLGILSRAAEGAFPRNSWQKARRSAIVEEFSNMPASSSSPALQKMIRGVLLSETDAGLMQNDIPAEPGQDLFTVRLNKLMEGGAYDEAFRLYGLADKPLHAAMAKAGILSMLYADQKALACLELKALEIPVPKDSFWEDLTAYCNIRFSFERQEKDAKQIQNSDRKILSKLLFEKDYVFPYTHQGFSALSSLEQALLSAEGKMSVSVETLKNILPHDIAALLRALGLNDEARFLLTASAVEYGLKEWEELAKLTETLGKPLKDAKIEDLNEWQKPAFYYARLQDETEKKHFVDNLEAALSLDNPVRHLYPFAPFLKKMEPDSDSLSLAHAHKAFLIFYCTDNEIPRSWIEALEKARFETDRDKKIHLLLLLAVYKQSAAPFMTDSEKGTIQTLLKSYALEEDVSVKKIIEIIDKNDKNLQISNSNYEKLKNLTAAEDYVIPPHIAFERLKKVQEGGILGEVVLLSAAILRDKKLSDIKSVLLREIFHSLKTVGLINISNDLAFELVLEETKKEK